MSNHLLAILIPSLATPAYFAGLAYEHSRIRRRREQGGFHGRGYERPDTWANLTMGTGFLGLNLLLGLAFLGPLNWLYDRRLVDAGTGVWAWIVLAVVWDFAFYWMHRAEHEVRLLWASHVVHHSSEDFNLSTALRQPWTPYPEHLFLLPLAWLGFEPTMVIAMYGLNLLYQFWIHTEIVDRGPRWFEAVFNTASHHRVHHGSNPQYLDRNYGGVLVVWDRLFGTFEPEREPVVYGLTKNIHSFSPWTIAFHEYGDIWQDVRTAPDLRHRIGHVLRGPGWSAEQLSLRG